MILILALFVIIRQQLISNKEIEIHWISQNRQRTLNMVIENHLQTITDIGGLLNLVEDVNAETLSRLARPLLQKHPGIRALHWVPLVLDAERNQWEETWRHTNPAMEIKERTPDGNFIRAKQRDRYYPIAQTFPSDAEVNNPGMDLFTDRKLSETFQRAESNNRIAISDRLPFLHTQTDQQSEIAVILPLDPHKESVRTRKTAKKQQPTSFLVAILRIDILTNTATDLLEPRGIEFLIQDESARTEDKFLAFYTSRLNQHLPFSPETRTQWNNPALSRIVFTFPVADRLWSMTCAATNQFRSTEAFQNAHWFTLMGGLVFILLTTYHLSQTKRQILQRIQIEQTLREREELFRQMTETVDEVFWAMDPKGIRFTYISPTLTRISSPYEKKSHQFLSEFIQLIHPEDQHLFLDAFHSSRMTKNNFSVIMRIKLDTRHYGWIRSCGFPVLDNVGQIIRIVGYYEDITDRKLAEDALRASEEKLRTLFKHSPDIILIVDRTGQILLGNRSMPSITSGYICDVLSEMQVPASIQEKYRQAMGDVFGTGNIQSFQLVTHLAQWWEIRMAPILSNGQTVAVMTIITDITENRKLQHSAIENARLASIGVLAAGVAHEINNPNQAILSNASLFKRIWQDADLILQDYCEENGDFSLGGLSFANSRQSIAQGLSDTIQNARRIKNMVDNLKFFSKRDSGQLDDIIDIHKLFQAIRSILDVKIRHYTHHFNCDIPENLPRIKGNFQQLEQVFVNIIMNALESLPTQDQKVHISATQNLQKNCLEIRIMDQGKGISAEDSEHILEPFFTTKEKSGGTGLGLSISHSIIEHHHGELTIVSHPEEGTTVTVSIPVLS
ncbi:MAG: CHASE domain-containing protein [Magnetococcales bacterium]|nr:CHASE domain-containing protein [Magnetococcales bacterium]